jgi:hypothetical protein
MPATTEFARNKKIDKLVGYLPIDEAVQLWTTITSAISVIAN